MDEDVNRFLGSWVPKDRREVIEMVKFCRAFNVSQDNRFALIHWSCEDGHLVERGLDCIDAFEPFGPLFP